ncbi:hypothetical protein Hanom_Chr04g00328301 [Helianthus anomalus]
MEIGEGKVLHLSQACLGEIKNTKSSEKRQISHNWNNGSVFFYGYKADQPIDGLSDDEDIDSDLRLWWVVKVEWLWC